MEVTSTQMKNNFGKYLQLCTRERINITKNGRVVARLVDVYEDFDVLSGTIVAEQAGAYRLPKTLMTYEDFTTMNRNAKERYEFIDGEVFLLSSPKVNHQYTSIAITKLFLKYFDGKRCQPFAAPFDLTLLRQKNENSKSVVQPDLMVICDLKQHLNEKGYYMGTPRLVVEITSPSSKKTDQFIKLDLYRDAGIEETWIVDPELNQIIIYQFENYEIKTVLAFHAQDTLKSIIFEDLFAEMDALFMK